MKDRIEMERGQRVKIKICGLRRPEDIAYVNEVEPDFVGFVFAPASRRYVKPGLALELRRQLKPGIVPVGVFVNEDPKQVASLLEQGMIEMAQLHGQENEAYLERLRSLTACPLIKAFCIETEADVKRAEQSGADGILLDHGPGGTGEAFDWSLLGQVKRPYILAGGLNPENVGQALQRTNPWAVDVSSGVETEGRKDLGKIRKFVEKIRESERNCYDNK